MSYEQMDIINGILDYMEKVGGDRKSWYVGIAKDAPTRLFDDHRVREYNDHWIYFKADSSQAARNVESFFVKILKTDGGLGGGDIYSDMVYAYKKGYHTIP
ncbi:MAG: hypothetical protein WHT07_08330 [Desulfobaccales bacterium]